MTDDDFDRAELSEKQLRRIAEIDCELDKLDIMKLAIKPKKKEVDKP